MQFIVFVDKNHDRAQSEALELMLKRPYSEIVFTFFTQCLCT